MREIKFRGISKITNKWVYGNLTVSLKGGYYISKDRELFSEPVHKESVGQYTGLLAKEGKEIYEKDILRCHYRKHKDKPYGYDYHYSDIIVEYNNKKGRFEPEFYLDTDKWTMLCNSSLAMKGNQIIEESGTKVMQFTGLLDKNKVEIYEGDIINCNVLPLKGTNIQAVIVFKEGCFFVVMDTCTEFPICTSDYFLEVVGNIYENEDLLKNGK